MVTYTANDFISNPVNIQGAVCLKINSLIPFVSLPEPESSADQDDQGGGRSWEGADPSGAQGLADQVTRAGQTTHPRPHQWHQDLRHHQGTR